MKISIFGTGYVGLVTGLCFADKGHNVTCVDIDESKVTKLSSGETTFYEPGVPQLLKSNLEKKHVEFTSDTQKAVESAEVIFIAVGTPQADDGSANLTHFLDCARGIAEYARDGQVIVDKSTVPVGTAKKVEAIFEEAGKKVHVVSNPETLREGAAVKDFSSPDRIIIGARSPVAFEIMREVYSPFMIREEEGRLLEMNPESAELVKYGANSMLAQRVSFINFLSQVANQSGADIRDVRKGIGTDWRIGMHFLYPGPGFGGSCFPKDVAALAYHSRKMGVDPVMLDATLDTNDRQKEFVASLVLENSGDNVGILGLSFKAKTDDVRDSASLYLAKELLKAGKTLYVHDPQAAENFLLEVPEAKSMSKEEVLEKADTVVIMTEWNEYRVLSDEELALLQGKTIVDGRNLLARKSELDKLKKNKIKYFGLGVMQ